MLFEIMEMWLYREQDEKWIVCFVMQQVTCNKLMIWTPPPKIIF